MTNPFEKALDDMLAMPHLGKDAIFHPDVGPSLPLRVIYGKDPSMMSMGEFETMDYEHQFLCRAKDIPADQRQAQIELDGRFYPVGHIKTKEFAAFILSE